MMGSDDVEGTYIMVSLRGREKWGQRKHELDMSVYQRPHVSVGWCPSIDVPS